MSKQQTVGFIGDVSTPVSNQDEDLGSRVTPRNAWGSWGKVIGENIGVPLGIRAPLIINPILVGIYIGYNFLHYDFPGRKIYPLPESPLIC